MAYSPNFTAIRVLMQRRKTMIPRSITPILFLGFSLETWWKKIKPFSNNKNEFDFQNESNLVSHAGSYRLSVFRRQKYFQWCLVCLDFNAFAKRLIESLLEKIKPKVMERQRIQKWKLRKLNGTFSHFFSSAFRCEKQNWWFFNLKQFRSCWTRWKEWTFFFWRVEF